MLRKKFFLIPLFTAIILLSAAGCSIIGGFNTIASNPQATETMTAIPPTKESGQAYTLTDSQACQVKAFPSIQVATPQGDLIAWSSAQTLLAFVEPQNQNWGWSVGDLVIYDPVKDKPVFTSQNLAVFGDLTWSPDGSRIAYVVLNQDSGVYTVDVTDWSAGNSVDVFGGGTQAQTDAWSSNKSIVNWAVQDRLVVNSSCGIDCMRSYTVNLTNNSLTPGTEIRKSEDTSLIPVSSADSPDGKWTIVTDASNNVWLSTPANNDISLLLENTTPVEIKWAETSSYFAIRTADQVLIYSFNCSKLSQ